MKTVNPFEGPGDENLGSHFNPVFLSNWHAYWIGFGRGACWSILVAPIAMLGYYSEAIVNRSYAYDSITNTRVEIDLSKTEILGFAVETLSVSIASVTLPWAITAGFVHLANERKRRNRANLKPMEKEP